MLLGDEKTNPFMLTYTRLHKAKDVQLAIPSSQKARLALPSATSIFPFDPYEICQSLMATNLNKFDFNSDLLDDCLPKCSVVDVLS